MKKIYLLIKILTTAVLGLVFTSPIYAADSTVDRETVYIPDYQVTYYTTLGEIYYYEPTTQEDYVSMSDFIYLYFSSNGNGTEESMVIFYFPPTSISDLSEVTLYGNPTPIENVGFIIVNSDDSQNIVVKVFSRANAQPLATASYTDAQIIANRYTLIYGFVDMLSWADELATIQDAYAQGQASMLGQIQNSYNEGFNDGYSGGYRQAEIELTFNNYNEGFNDAKEQYGYWDDVLGIYVSADYAYDEGYDAGLNADFDYFAWMRTALWLPAQILAIEIWPGFQLGYFAFFTLFMGMIGFIFRLFGKGGK